MNIYLMIYLGLQFMGLGIALNQHNEEKTGKYNFWISLLSFVIVQSLLYYAGLYKNIL